MPDAATPVVFIPSWLCDEALYSDVITAFGKTVEAHVLSAFLPRLADSVADILARAPARFALVGTFCAAEQGEGAAADRAAARTLRLASQQSAFYA